MRERICGMREPQNNKMKPKHLSQENFDLIMSSPSHRKAFGFEGDFARKKDAIAYTEKHGGKVQGYLNGRLKRGWIVI